MSALFTFCIVSVLLYIEKHRAWVIKRVCETRQQLVKFLALLKDDVVFQKPHKNFWVSKALWVHTFYVKYWVSHVTSHETDERPRRYFIRTWRLSSWGLLIMPCPVNILLPRYQNESSCRAIHMKMHSLYRFFFKQIKLIFSWKKVLHKDLFWNRDKVTRKWPFVAQSKTKTLMLMTETLSTKILLLFQKRPTKRRIVTQFWLFSFMAVMCKWVEWITLAWFENPL